MTAGPDARWLPLRRPAIVRAEGVALSVRRVVVWAVVVALAVGVLVYIGRRPILTAVGGFLIAHDPPRSADAIVVLSGSVPDRILEAVDLYQAHLAPSIILSPEVELPGLAALRARGAALPEHHEQNSAIAQQLGVPAGAIVVIPARSASTVDEIQAAIRYLHAHGIHSVLLVTSKAHSRRAGMIFRGFAGDRLAVAVCASRHDPFAADTWWHSRALVRRVVIEYGKLLAYLVVDRWRPRSVVPEA